MHSSRKRMARMHVFPSILYTSIYLLSIRTVRPLTSTGGGVVPIMLSTSLVVYNNYVVYVIGGI